MNVPVWTGQMEKHKQAFAHKEGEMFERSEVNQAGFCCFVTSPITDEDGGDPLWTRMCLKYPLCFVNAALGSRAARVGRAETRAAVLPG